MDHQTLSDHRASLDDDHWSPDAELFAEVLSLSGESQDDDVWD